MDNTYYVEVLKNIKSFFLDSTFDLILAILFTIVLILMIIIYFKKIKDKRYVIAFIIITIVLPVIGFVAYRYNLNNIDYDIENETFDSYVGEIKIDFLRLAYGHSEDTGKIRGTDLTIVDLNNKYETYPDYTPITSGKSRGTIIYGRNSKRVVYWDVVKLEC